jgi:hypothetical protein
MKTEDGFIESWSIDSPLIEIIDEQVSFEESKPKRQRSLLPKNGKAKAALARKKKPAKRRKP